MIVTTAQLFRHAYGRYAVGAYNINNAEQAMGLFQGCVQSEAPFIIQISKGARKYTDKRMLEAIIRTAEVIFPEAIFAVHLDHGDEATCYDCIASGFYSSVMIDASHENFERNAEISKRVVTAAHAKGISVEAELGMLGGVEEDIKVEEGHRPSLTDPADAEKFVQLRPAAIPSPDRHRDEPWRLQVQGQAVAPFRRAEKDQGPDAGLSPRHARLVLASRRRRFGGSTPPVGKIADAVGVDENEYLPAAKLLGRHEGQHRHRRPPGLDAGSIGSSSATSRANSTFEPPGKIFMDGVRELHRPQEPEARQRRPDPWPGEKAWRNSKGQVVAGRAVPR